MTIRTGVFYLGLILSLAACGGDDGSTIASVPSTDPSPVITPTDPSPVITPTDPSPSGTLIANAGIDQNVLTGSRVRLDGSASEAADGERLAYAWSMLLNPSGSRARLSDATVVNPTFVADRDGRYVARLVVNDGESDSAPDMVTITAATTNLPPVANAGPDQTVKIGATVRLDGSGSTDANGDALRYFWTPLRTPSGSSAVLSNPSAVNPTFTADRDGSYVFRLVANDGTVDSAPDTIAVTAAAEGIYVSIDTFGASIPETNAKWWGGVKGPNGKIYGIPYDADDVLIIDPATNTAKRSSMGAESVRLQQMGERVSWA